jgi:hypothetical protein
MMSKGNGKRGRPLGFKLSEDTKRAISESKKGQKHKEETKNKISRSLIIYFKNKNPLSEEITNTYCRADDDRLCAWINEVCEELDSFEDVVTERSLRNKAKVEVTCGHYIELFSHNFNPELIYLFKEFCEENGLKPEDVLDEVI